MDKSKMIKCFLVLCSIVLISCEKKTEESVYVDESQKPQGNGCYSEPIAKSYLVYYEDGSVGTVQSESLEDLKKSFIRPNLEKIRWVEHNQRVFLEETKTKSIEKSTMFTDVNWGQSNIEAQQLWNQNIKGQGIIVGIVDSGVDVSHPQLKGQIQINENETPYNGLDDDGNGLIDDHTSYDFYAKKGDYPPSVDHGSHVAGIITAAHQAPSLPLGVAPESKIIATNFLSHQAGGGGDLDDAIAAIKYTVSRGAKVVNASWGGAPCSVVLSEVIASLESQDVLMVVAAGNEHTNIDYFPSYPAAYNLPTQITVGAIGPSNIMTGFSNYGEQMVHLMAPGDLIYSTVIGGYESLAGTSMAAPFVSGAAALLWSAKPTATAKQIKQALLSSVIKSNYRVTTRGRLNLPAALNEINKL